MKTFITTALLILCTSLTFAAKGDKDKAARKAKRAALEAVKAFDKNANKTLDSEEVAALEKAFSEAPKGPLAQLDRKQDGKLSDDIEKLNKRLSAKKEAKGKNTPAPTSTESEVIKKAESPK